MALSRPLNRRTAVLSVADCLEVFERGKLPRPSFMPRDGNAPPAVDVYDMLLSRDLVSLRRRVESLCMALSKPVAVRNGDSSSCSTVSMPDWLSQFPEIWEFLSKPSYKDGTFRQLGKVTLSLESGGIRMSLTDPSSSTYCSRQHQSLADAMLVFELGLGDGSLTWRASGPPKGKKRP